MTSARENPGRNCHAAPRVARALACTACLLLAVAISASLGCTYERQLPEITISGGCPRSAVVKHIEAMPGAVVLRAGASDASASETKLSPGERATFKRAGHGEETWRFLRREGPHAIMHVAGSHTEIGFWPCGPEMLVCFDRDALVCTRAAAADGTEQFVVRLGAPDAERRRPPPLRFTISGPRVLVQRTTKLPGDGTPGEQTDAWLTPEQEFEVPGCNLVETWKLRRIDVDTNHVIFTVRGRVFYCTDPFAIFLGIPSHSYTETVVVCLPVTGESATGPVHTSHTSARDAIAGACE